MRKTIYINTLLLTDEELLQMNFNNKDGLYCSIRFINGTNEVKVYMKKGVNCE